jgi:fumarylpyruvate hydrolase
MGFEPEREPPFFFMKPGDAVVPDGATVAYPPDTADFQFEAELVIAIGKGGANIPLNNALDHVYGYAAGIDLTRRDRQIEARDRGRPWEMGKSFDGSAPLGAIHPASEVGHLAEGPIRLFVDGEVKQDSDLVLMIWKTPEIVSILSRSVRLEPGDLIYSGTPAGVGAVHPGDEIRLEVAALSPLTVRIGTAA